jgi:hypothetical protein
VCGRRVEGGKRLCGVNGPILFTLWEGKISGLANRCTSKLEAFWHQVVNTIHSTLVHVCWTSWYNRWSTPWCLKYGIPAEWQDWLGSEGLWDQCRASPVSSYHHWKDDQTFSSGRHSPEISDVNSVCLIQVAQKIYFSSHCVFSLELHNLKPAVKVPFEQWCLSIRWCQQHKNG